ncbi:hypothetical protein [Achromobacter anxifer]|uniref:hypothetical protein n=1 Tax=Achromobacter anxifer TaxID=1287737 RepID=UPI0021589745|nr:hypothetical protein [Achromobacter anxifer]
MEWELRVTVFSAPRMGRYLNKYGGDTLRAAVAYDHNVLLAQALMPALQTLEIVLRNAIHRSLSRSMGNSDWWNCLPTPEFDWLHAAVNDAGNKIQRRRERVTIDKIVAELTFGSWTRLFNAQYGLTLWGRLLLAFPTCPKIKRQRGPISSSLNRIRDLRNRVMHHEPLLWVAPSVNEIHADILEVLDWIDPGINLWLARHDALPTMWAEGAAI